MPMGISSSEYSLEHCDHNSAYFLHWNRGIHLLNVLEFMSHESDNHLTDDVSDLVTNYMTGINHDDHIESSTQIISLPVT